jgi:hypothetical protein
MTLGRIKGNAAEREIARKLEDYWRPIEEARFVRTPLSGGWGGKDLRAEFKASGDLMTTAKRWPFVVEVKRRENWSWKPFLAGKKSPIWGWWLQACAAADELAGAPLLIFRKSREPWSIVLPHEVYSAAKVSRETLVLSRPHAWYRHELEGRAGKVQPIKTTFDDFLRTAPEQWIHACAEAKIR